MNPSERSSGKLSEGLLELLHSLEEKIIEQTGNPDQFLLNANLVNIISSGELDTNLEIIKDLSELNFSGFDGARQAAHDRLSKLNK